MIKMKTRRMKLKTAVMVIVPLLLLVSILGSPVAQVYAVETIVGIESAEDMETGSIFDLSIYLAEATNIVGLGFELYWDPAVINIPSIRLSDNLPSSTNTLTVNIDPVLGKAIVALVNTESPDYLTVTENTPILTLTIEAVGSPGDSTTLNLEKVELSDADFNPIVPNVIDGIVSIYTTGIISINVDPGDIDFGQIYEGGSGTSSVTITNDGTIEVSVTATLGSEDPVGFYTDNLKIFEIGLGYVYVVEWNLVLPSKYEESVPLELTIPYLCSAGDKTAILTFWAETP